jgi:glycosyltransferase involved in cell wall biosynthesis
MRIACVSGAFTWRGAHRVLSTLAGGFADRGHEVTYLTTGEGEALRAAVPDEVATIDFGTSGILKALPALRRHLAATRPDVLLSATEHVNVVAGLAALSSGSGVRTFASCHNIVDPPGICPNLRMRLQRRLMATIYPRLAGVVAVSEGVANSLSAVIGLPRAAIDVIYNPVVTPAFERQRRTAADHPFIRDRTGPVVVAAGSLTQQKGFDDLLAALALVRGRLPVRAIILGEGPDRGALEAQVGSLGLRESVSLPGYVSNVAAFMEAADLFVLSSHYEGFGLVLAEALAVGTPVVSTDCRAGPREILEDGTWGRLVPVGDTQALGAAIVAALAETPDRERLRRRGAAFSLDAAVSRYLARFEAGREEAAA